MSKAFVDACEAGDVAAARRFLAQGGDPNSKDQGFPALYVAAQKGHIEVVQLLLGGGAAVDRPAKNGATPLSVASWNGHVAVVGALLGGGAAVDQPNKNGATSLYIASEKGHVAAVEALLGGGAAVDRPTKDGATPLFVASFKGHVAAVHALLGGGATVDQPMHNGATPLYKASQEGHADVVRHLLVAGANRACAWQGKTPLNIAQQQGHAEVVALLRNPPAAPTPAPAPAPQPAPPPTATAAALTQLAQDFPGVQPEVISTVLAACGGDATQAHAALQQMAPPAPAPAPADLGATPEPEPTAAAEEGEPPPLDAWLAQIGMSRYSAQIKEYGYDQLKTLLVATEDDIAEMTEDADTQMKKPHRRLFLAEWRVLKGAASGAASPGAASPGAGAPTSAAAAAAAAAPLPQLPDKYVAATQQIRLGQSADATKGLKSLLGIADKQVAQFLLKPEQSIIDEFAANGLAQDKGNLQLVLAGMYVDSNGEKKTLEQLLQHPHAVAAKLAKHHVLALRLYTTSSYAAINNPLRQEPVVRPHPFAATTYFITDAIKLLRTVAAQSADAHMPKEFWRGVKNMGLTSDFMTHGGTDFGCVSTTEDQAIAVHRFAASKLPLVFRVVTQSPLTRGADVQFLSVFPEEKEYLYPPLTFLRATDMKMETLCGVQLLVATVEPDLSGA